jgi:hypothetical protein
MTTGWQVKKKRKLVNKNRKFKSWNSEVEKKHLTISAYSHMQVIFQRDDDKLECISWI